MQSTITRIGAINKLSGHLLTSGIRNSFSCRIILSRNKYVGGYVSLYPKKYSRKYDVLRHVTTKVLYSSTTEPTYSPELKLTSALFERVTEDTLQSLTEYFEELVEKAAHLQDADVSYGDGVLTVKFGDPYGTYVINRQTPNKQIWLSSPKSGPKRYDFLDGKWIYKHDGQTLHELLDKEIPAIIRDQACFDGCAYSGREQYADFDENK